MDKKLKTDFSERNFAALRGYSFWEKIKHVIFEDIFDYPVVYTDGLISHRVKDSETHDAWGVIVNNFILCLKEPHMDSYDNIMEYCKDKIFAGQNLTAIDYDTLNKIKNNHHSLNEEIRRLNGDVIAGDWYGTSDTREVDTKILHMSVHINSTSERVYMFEAKIPIRTRLGIYICPR